jgi:TonB family protein
MTFYREWRSKLRKKTMWKRVSCRSVFVVGAMLQAVCILAAQTAQAPGGVTENSQAASPSDSGRVYGPPDHGVVGPKAIYAPNPEFSDKARSKKVSGTCVFSVVVDTKGNPQDIQLVKSIGDGLNPKLRSAAASLDQNAMAAVHQYRFEPAKLKGIPVPYRVNIEVTFRIY